MKWFTAILISIDNYPFPKLNATLRDNAKTPYSNKMIPQLVRSTPFQMLIPALMISPYLLVKDEKIKECFRTGTNCQGTKGIYTYVMRENSKGK